MSVAGRGCGIDPASGAPVLLDSAGFPVDLAHRLRLQLFDRIVTKPAKTIVLVRASRRSRRVADGITPRATAPFALALSDMRIPGGGQSVNQTRHATRRDSERIQVAANGSRPCRHYRMADFDAVLMDARCPKWTAEATRQIRSSDPVRNHIPVLHSPRTHWRGPHRCGRGVNDYLTKPINPIALQQALSRFTARGRAGRCRSPGSLR